MRGQILVNGSPASLVTSIFSTIRMQRQGELKGRGVLDMHKNNAAKSERKGGDGGVQSGITQVVYAILGPHAVPEQEAGVVVVLVRLRVPDPQFAEQDPHEDHWL